MRKGRRILVAGIALAVLLVASGCKLLEPPEPPPLPRITPVALPSPTVQATATPRPGLPRLTHQITRGTFVKTVAAPGSLAPAKPVALYSKSTGLLTELRVKTGDPVEKGEVLGRVEVSDPELAARQAERELAQARLSVMELQLKLAQTRSDPPAAKLEDQTATAQYALDQARLDLRKAQMRNYDKEVQAAERRLRWAQDDASMRAWWYEKIKDRDNLESAQAGQAATDAADRLDTAQQALDSLKAGKDLWLEELSLKERAVKNAEKRVEDLTRQATLLKDLYESQVLLLEKQVAEVEASLPKLEKAVARAGQPVELVAPATGMVIAVNLEPGDVVQAYSPILTVADPKVTRAVVNVAEADVVTVAVGQKVQVAVPALSASFSGQVTWIAVTPSRDKEPVYQAIVSLDSLDDRAKVGMTAQAGIVVLKKDDVLAVPSVAVRTRGNVQYVEVMDGDRASEVEVQVGLRNESEAEIVSGLREGQIISLGTRFSTEVGAGALPQGTATGAR